MLDSMPRSGDHRGNLDHVLARAEPATLSNEVMQLVGCWTGSTNSVRPGSAVAGGVESAKHVVSGRQAPAHHFVAKQPLLVAFEA
jgi:hypothetical protein